MTINVMPRHQLPAEIPHARLKFSIAAEPRAMALAESR
jgi:hypothetical protein